MTGRKYTGPPIVLYDGWALAYQPCSPAALHLLVVLELHPPGWQPVLVLPAPALNAIPAGVEAILRPFTNTPLNRLRWEQALLPAAAKECAARLVHLAAGAPALWGSRPAVLSPTSFSESGLLAEGESKTDGWAVRLRQAAGWGGLARLSALLWPQDLPLPDLQSAVSLLPGMVHPLFHPAQDGTAGAQERFLNMTGQALPETYILYHGPAGARDLELLFSAWSWAAGPIGETYPLVVTGIPEGRIAGLLDAYGLGNTVRLLPEIPLGALAALYQGCSLLFHPAQVAAWGDPVRLALACGKAVVALETLRCAALVGPAAFLAPADQAGRTLGAALLSVAVEESLSTSLGQAALRRSAGLDGRLFSSGLANVYNTYA